jgi:hypothetical protein
MFKKFLFKLVFNKEERLYIESALYMAERYYREEYNNIESTSYHSETLKNNIPKFHHLYLWI